MIIMMTEMTSLRMKLSKKIYNKLYKHLQEKKLFVIMK